ncbi:MAG TPA: hypothetical protein PLT11_03205 [Elusimicrobiota bacterium]|jgi:hypothetical protein|nr:hypothetical protein [Elusimicrobiota bacterium]HNA60053.1 hypothetical protein [Elusimicrobiota bacterium]HND63233.1 hypothetical protein [Elusimicrobiota bacterium]
MRNWTVALAALALAGSPAFAADALGLKNISTDGSIEVLGVSANNEQDYSDPANDHRGDTVTRVRVGLSADVTEDVKARVEAVRNPSTTSAAQYGNAARPTDLNTEQSAFKFQNAYLDLSNFLSLDSVRLGRQYVGRANDAIVYFGPVNDDLLGVSALDALAVSKKVGPVTLLGVTGKVSDDDVIATTSTATDAGDTAGDVNASWITASSDELIKLKDLKVPLEIGYYSMTNSNAAATSDNANLSIIDLRAGVQCPKDSFKVMLEYAMNGGQQNAGATKTKFKGSLLLLTAYWKGEDNAYGVHADFASASGDDTADTNDKSFHDIAGDYRWGEILSNDNVADVGVGFDSGAQGPGLNIVKIGGHYVLPVVDKKVSLHADYIMAKTSKSVTLAGGTSKKIGNEIDLAVKYKHSDNVMAKVGYAMLSPDDVLTGGGSAQDDQVSKAFAKLLVKWGNN